MKKKFITKKLKSKKKIKVFFVIFMLCSYAGPAPKDGNKSAGMALQRVFRQKFGQKNGL